MTAFFFGLRDLMICLSFLVIILLLFKRNKSILLEINLLYFLAMTVMEMVSLVLMQIFNNNLILLHINSIVEFAILSYYFKLYYTYLGGKTAGINIIIFGILFVLLLTIFSLNIYELSMSIASISFIIFCFYAYYLNLKLGVLDVDQIQIMFITGIFLMHSVSLIVLLFKLPVDSLRSFYSLFVYSFRSISMVLAKIFFLYAIIKHLYIIKPSKT